MGDQQIESQMIDDGPDMGGKNVHYYYGPKRMIETALDTLPNKRGTLKDIFQCIQENWNINLSNSQQPDYKKFSQSLCKYFKKEKGFYKLVKESLEIKQMLQEYDTPEKCVKMKEKLVYVLSKLEKAKFGQISNTYKVYFGDASMKKMNKKTADQFDKNIQKTLSSN